MNDFRKKASDLVWNLIVVAYCVVFAASLTYFMGDVTSNLALIATYVAVQNRSKP